MKRVLFSTASALMIVGAGSASAAVISFSAADFTNVNQVSTNGALVEAVNLGQGSAGDVNNFVPTSAVVLNGVTFASDPGNGTGQFVVDGGVATLNTFRSGASNDAFNANAFPGSSPIAGLSDADGNALFDSLEFGGGAGNSTARLTDLIIGTEYEVQILLSNESTNSDNTYSVGYAETFDGAAVFSVTDISTLTPTIVTGTFTADATTQDIHIARLGTGGAANIEAGAFQLRVVPEPGSLALLGLGGLAMLRRRRG
ncbi:MAG: PEP-CTERM sorting domain-containing protein [Phycisphaeraceae bacterium]|nr:PEP-CTERM sorting domain-containing protein [Phycisphaeraceae bacterium]